MAKRLNQTGPLTQLSSKERKIIYVEAWNLHFAPRFYLILVTIISIHKKEIPLTNSCFYNGNFYSIVANFYLYTCKLVIRQQIKLNIPVDYRFDLFRHKLSSFNLNFSISFVMYTIVDPKTNKLATLKCTRKLCDLDFLFNCAKNLYNRKIMLFKKLLQ